MAKLGLRGAKSSIKKEKHNSSKGTILTSIYDEKAIQGAEDTTRILELKASMDRVNKSFKEETGCDLSVKEWLETNGDLKTFNLRRKGKTLTFEKHYDFCSITIRKNLSSPVERELIGAIGSILTIPVKLSNEDILRILEEEYEIEST